MSTLQPRLLDPITDRSELRLKGVDTVIADPLDVQYLNPPLPLFNPQRGPAFAWGRTRRVLVFRWRYQRALPNRDNVGDT